jgi:catechol 2,3-dioxygenase-like lactoylglutathione lyase family enzyme
MAIVIDHTIVPAQDRKKSADFYAKIFAFEDLGEKPGSYLHPVRVNDSTVLFFMNMSERESPLGARENSLGLRNGCPKIRKSLQANPINRHTVRRRPF